MTKKRRKDIDERYLNNSGTPTAVVIPVGLYYSVELPKCTDSMDVKSYDYKNHRVLYSESQVDGWEKSEGVLVVPFGLRLYTHDLDAHISFDGRLDEYSVMDMLDKIYCDTRCPKYKIHIITDNWDSEFS